MTEVDSGCGVRHSVLEVVVGRGRFWSSGSCRCGSGRSFSGRSGGGSRCNYQGNNWPHVRVTQDDEGTRGPADDRWGRGVDKDRAVGGCEELGLGEEVAGCDWNKPGLMGCNQDRAMNVCLVSFGSCEGQADQCDDDDSDECLKIFSQKF